MSDIMTAGTMMLAENQRWDGPGPWWPIFPILWILFIVGIFFLISRFGLRRGWRSGTHSGESRLAERFAAGEIGEQEYRDRIAVLREKRR